MAEETKTETTAAAPQEGGNRVFCFVSKREILENDATQVAYLKGEKVWVGKQYVKGKV